VRIQAVTEDIAQGLGAPSASGALITDVTPKGPAAKAGIQNGDLIVGFDGKPVGDSRALPRAVAETAVGKTVPVDILRKGKKETVSLPVAKLQDERPMRAAPPATVAPPQAKPKSRMSQLGLSLASLDGDARTQFHVPKGVQGVVVTDVSPESPAAEKNFRP